MSQVVRPGQRLSGATPFSSRQIKINVSALVFWLMFALCYLFLSRFLVIATLGKYRLGVVVVALSLLSLFFYRSLVKNIALIATTVALCGVILLSAWVNKVSLGEFISFVRIPIIAYLVYHLVWHFLNSQARAEKVLRYLYTIAAFQLPVIALQRFAYPWLPARLKFGSLTGQLSLADFGQGSFTGDSSMSFCLVSLLILLLFDRRVQALVKKKWLVAVWLTLTVLFANSQIQHVTIVLVWGIFFLSHLRLKTFVAIGISAVVLVGLLAMLFQAGVMTFRPIYHTQAKVSRFLLMSEEEKREEAFLSGGHARDAAIQHYLHEPVKWIGDGPGMYYDTATRERTIGNWGHVFTFYTEVGLIGWLLSVCFFFVLAFPVRIGRSTVRMRASWVRLLMFFSINILCFAKYPMNDSSMMFTYCVILVGHQVLAVSQPKDSPKHQAASITISV